MVRSSKEDYLKQLYRLDGYQHWVSNKHLAEKMQVSAPSVTEMLMKMQKDHLIEYIPYKGSRLTIHGNEYAINLIRKHRLWEYFLFEKLDYPWSKIHLVAEELEHITPDDLLEKLDAFLDYPQNCPHGSPIPQKGYIEETRNLILLSGCIPHDIIKISTVFQDAKLLDYLDEIQLKIGDQYTIEYIEPYEGNIHLNGYKKIKISYKAASQIFVIKIKNKDDKYENE